MKKDTSKALIQFLRFAQRLRRWAEGEGILDDFVNGYWGRVYGKKYAKELLTKSYEVLLGNNSEAFYNFFKKDPNLFGFALASLVRFGK